TFAPMNAVRSTLLAAAAGATLFGAPAAAQATADEQYAGRVRALALDARCRLFSDDVKIALESGAPLARSAVLPAGCSAGAGAGWGGGGDGRPRPQRTRRRSDHRPSRKRL